MSKPYPRAPNQNKTGHIFHLVTYCNEMQIKIALSQLKYRHYAYILHDKDVWTLEDEQKNSEHKAGELKVVHYHVLITFVDKTTEHSVLRQFRRYCDDIGKPINTMCRVCSDKSFEFDYLDHSRYDCVLKGYYRYPHENIITDKHSYWQSATHTDFDPLSQLFIDFYSGVPYIDLFKKYGKLFIIHKAKIEELAFMMARNEKFDPKENYAINKPNVYYFGV